MRLELAGALEPKGRKMKDYDDLAEMLERAIAVGQWQRGHDPVEWRMSLFQSVQVMRVSPVYLPTDESLSILLGDAAA